MHKSKNLLGDGTSSRPSMMKSFSNYTMIRLSSKVLLQNTFAKSPLQKVKSYLSQVETILIREKLQQTSTRYQKQGVRRMKTFHQCQLYLKMNKALRGSFSVHLQLLRLSLSSIKSVKSTLIYGARVVHLEITTIKTEIVHVGSVQLQALQCPKRFQIDIPAIAKLKHNIVNSS